MQRTIKVYAAVMTALLCSACVSVGGGTTRTDGGAPGVTKADRQVATDEKISSDVKIEQGTASRSVTGAAGGAASVNASVARCDATLGTVAIDDGRQSDWGRRFTKATDIPNVEPMIRLMVQQSNCFIITTQGNSAIERGVGSVRTGNRGSEFRVGSNVQSGQRVASDFFLKPEIFISGATDARSSKKKSILDSMFASTTATVTLSLIDIRAGTILAASEGSASVRGLSHKLNTDARTSSYNETPAGAVTLAAFADAYAKLVIALRNYQSQSVQGGAGTGGILEVQGR